MPPPLNTETGDPLYSIDEASIYLEMSRRTIFARIADAKLPVVRRRRRGSHGPRTFIHLSSLNALLEEEDNQ